MIGQFIVKFFVKKKVEVTNKATGKIELIEQEVPHPMYQKTLDAIK